jgi:hypothetical protein
LETKLRKAPEKVKLRFIFDKQVLILLVVITSEVNSRRYRRRDAKCIFQNQGGAILLLFSFFSIKISKKLFSWKIRCLKKKSRVANAPHPN